MAANKMATNKQINYALDLLEKAGYPTYLMDESFKALKVPKRECESGITVTNWLKGLTTAEASRLIDRLKRLLEE